MSARTSTDPRRTARTRWYAEQRLQRLGVRLEKSRGTVMNFAWLHWHGEWCNLHEALCGREDCNHG